MYIDNENQSNTINSNKFNILYRNIRFNLNELIVGLQIFDYDFSFFEPEIKNYMNIDSIMYLSNELYTYYFVENNNIYNNAIGILSNDVLTDDSEIKDVNLHIHYYLLTYIIHYQDKEETINNLKNLLLEMYKDINILIENGTNIEMLKMELMFEESRI